MNNTETAMNFKDLLEKYMVEIPLIQRDYAQGRPDEKTKIDSFLKDIKDKFLKDIGGKEKDVISLNFIYGYLNDRNKTDRNKTDRNKTFVPLDGQQRLTLLFLLHYYALVRDGKENGDFEILGKFRYAMRRSTTLFLERLLSDKNNGIRDKIKEDKKLSEIIQGENWFFPQWKRDPTISSMLAVLDRIHEEFKDVNGLQKKLKNIRFNFLNVEGLGQTETETEKFYVRINSRGKPLTEFENYRAELLKRLEDEKQFDVADFKEHFKRNLDGYWTDVFWEMVPKNNSNEEPRPNSIFDAYYLCLIKNILVNEDVNENKSSSKEDLYDAVESKKERDKSNFEAIYYTLNLFYAMKRKAGNNFKTDYPFFETLVTKPYHKTKNNSKSYIKSEVGTYPELALLYAITVYAKNKKVRICTCKSEEPQIKVDEDEVFNLDHFQSWYRIMRNLILNSSIDKGNFRNVLNSIRLLYDRYKSESKKFFVDFFKDNVSYNENKDKWYAGDASSDNNNEIIGFSKEQLGEERRKAELISKDVDGELKKVIEKAEKNRYFTGQISFFLYLTNLWDSNEIDDQKSDAYCDLLDAIFGEKDNGLGLLIDSVLWRRALIAMSVKGSGRECYPCVYDTNRKTFVNDNPKGAGSWKHYLSEKYTFRNLVKNLLDGYLNDQEKNNDINAYLHNILYDPELLKGLKEKGDFMYYFLMENGVFSKSYREGVSIWCIEINDNDDHPTYLYNSEDRRGDYYEWSLVKLALELENRFKVRTKLVPGTPAKGWQLSIDGKNLDVKINFKDGDRHYSINCKDKENTFENVNEVETFIEGKLKGQEEEMADQTETV